MCAVYIEDKKNRRVYVGFLSSHFWMPTIYRINAKLKDTPHLVAHIRSSLTSGCKKGCATPRCQFLFQEDSDVCKRVVALKKVLKVCLGLCVRKNPSFYCTVVKKRDLHKTSLNYSLILKPSQKVSTTHISL